MSVTPGLTVSPPVTWMRECAGQVVFDAIVPLTAVKTGAASKLIAGFAVRPFSTAFTFTVPAAVAAGAFTEPHPRRICTLVDGNPLIATMPLRRTVSFEPSTSLNAIGTDIPTGKAEGAITLNVLPTKADGASCTVLYGVCDGIPSSLPPRALLVTMNRTSCELTSAPPASLLSA